ncbi:GNAT family N-acetyltransferase, partial [Rhabdothermincola sp.]|uniref:GNAT family N-acetyltransferase n=1 Tax=Rhabdothermincola sp. TaxID=2820405 RepID=UPI002FE3D8F3
MTGAVRQATEADAEAIVALAVEAFGESDGPAVRAYQGFGEGVAMWTVVDDGGRVVSASARIPHTFSLDGVELPGSQIEYVATAASHRRQGLVRAQFEHHHARAAAEGELIQFIGGIPYLYRRFGYGYGLDHPLLFLTDETRLARQVSSSGSPPQVRDATPDDLDDLLALETRRPDEGIRTVRDRARWQLHLDLAASGPFEHLLVSECGGRITGWARLHHRPEERQLHFLPSVCAEPGALPALVRAGLALAGDSVLVIYDSTDPLVHAELRTIGSSLVYDLGIYARVADPVAMLQRLQPVLSARLAASPYAGRSGELAISLYTSGVRIAFERGEVVGVDRAPAVEDPAAEQGVG